MTYNHLVKHYGSAPKAARALGFTRMGVHAWKRGGIPIRTQELIQSKTGGALKAAKK